MNWPETTGVEGGVTGDEGADEDGGTDDDGGIVGRGSAIVTRVEMFPRRHDPVIGQRRTPVAPSAHKRRVPGRTSV